MLPEGGHLAGGKHTQLALYLCHGHRHDHSRCSTELYLGLRKKLSFKLKAHESEFGVIESESKNKTKSLFPVSESVSDLGLFYSLYF